MQSVAGCGRRATICFQGGRTDSGTRVSELVAFQTTTFLACVDIIAGKISSLPRHVFERSQSDAGRERHRIAYEHDYYDLVALEPNDEMSGNTMWKAFMCHCLAWSNGYIELQRDEGNGIVALWPRNPGKTRPRRLTTAVRLEAVPWRPFPLNLPAGTMVYQTTDGIDNMDQSELDAKSHSVRFIAMEDMLHVPGLSFDGRIGQSVVWLARQTIGLALATEKFGAKYFANFAKPGGILEMPMNMLAADKEQSKRSWMEAQGGENAHRVAVMPPGFKFTPMSNNPQEAQTIETRKFSRNEICALFHVPPHMVGETDKGRAMTEQLAQELKEFCFGPWLSAIVNEAKRKLFPHRGLGRTPRSPFYLDFDLSEMLRPDAASREKLYASGKQWGYLNSNDIHGMEKLNPIDDPTAEEYWMPVNMTLTSTPIDPTFQDGAGHGTVPEGGAGGSKKKTTPAPDAIKTLYSGLFRDGCQRFLASRRKDAGALTRCLGPILEAIRSVADMQAIREFDVTGDYGAVVDRFIGEYIGGMTKRSGKWDASELDEIVDRELGRAIQAIRIAVFREAATHKAKMFDEMIEGATDEG